jgi:Amt family ammonium transporter
VFFMQVGFLALETGSGRAKNVRNILLKNLLNVMLAALVWWAVGYAFAYGQSAAGVIGCVGPGQSLGGSAGRRAAWAAASAAA